MKIVVAPRLLIKSSQPKLNRLALFGGTVEMRELCPNEKPRASRAAAGAPRWYLAEVGAGLTAPSTAEIWDAAHQASEQHDAYVEPDIGSQWDYENHVRGGFAGASGELCSYHEQSEDFPRGTGFAWHLDLSQLKCAREKIGDNPAPVRIGILDTGFDFEHQARPRNLLLSLQRNFVDDGQAFNDASDPYARGPFKNPGHGTGTLGILAGRKLENMAQSSQNGMLLGGAPDAEVLPVRIANGVVLLYASAFAAGLDYLIAPNGDRSQRVDVLSMSMGGLASKAWADVVNRAYDAGIVMVTAAGNNYPATPQSIVYPARFRRVIAACGVMADGRPYTRANVPFGKMAGNYGPKSKMDTALAAYTPNTPWAEIHCEAVVDMDGAGTSSATPQIAAAAALWLQRHKKEMNGFAGFEIVEAVRKALFDSANSKSAHSQEFFGRGILQALEALSIAPQRGLPALPPDSAQFEFWKVITGRGIAAAAALSPQEEMLGVEVAQLFQIDPDVEKSMPDPDAASQPTQNFFDAVIGSPYASKALKTALRDQHLTTSVPGAELDRPSPPMPPRNQSMKISEPQKRRLRAYATDPSLSVQLQTYDSNQVTIDVPWEKLGQGPTGEYIEVIDYDPATKCFYAPVNLQSRNVIATDGLEPDPANPQFHQQMVYAVAMRTIWNFEVALGRKALWAPMMKPGESNDAEYVGQLRIYPHAFRGQNAFYNPEKKALLFGYFPVQCKQPGELYPDGVAFTCQSHDIVAHETTHALLDGMNRNLSAEGSVDDFAFHEAFADLVALFQHFSLPEVLKAEIAKTRGELSMADRLAEIGQEFGRAIGQHGALRKYIQRTPDPSLIANTSEPHDRGALLVAAVFGAFLAIYQRRTADLVRLATDGQGILKPGAIPLDLANRLAEEARKTAKHIGNLCVRALDFCPPVDLTFGDYLQAIITADFEVMPEDDLGYRVAIVESFRNWGIYPNGLQTLSPQSLRWHPLQFPESSQPILSAMLGGARSFVDRWRCLSVHTDFAPGMALRERQFHFARQWRETLHEALKEQFQAATLTQRKELGADLGLDLTTGREKFELHSLRVAEKIGADNFVFRHLLLQLLQHRNEMVNGTPIRFAGGCTLVVDEETMEVKYSIRKSICNRSRLEQIKSAMTASPQLRDLYFSGTPFNSVGERFAILHSCKEDL